MKKKLNKMNASYEESKHSRTRGVDVFVYSYSQIRPSRHHEPSAWHDDSCTSNVYVFFGGMVREIINQKICIQQVMHCADFVEYFQVPCFYRTAPKEAVAMQAQLILMMPTMKQSIQIYIRHN